MTTLSVGRSDACDIVLDDPTVSRRHAVLTMTGAGTYRFVDQGSTSGSYRMEAGLWQAMNDAELRESDRVRLGSFEATVAGLLLRGEALCHSRPATAEQSQDADTVPIEAYSSCPPDAGASLGWGAGSSDAVEGPLREPRPSRTVVQRDPFTGRILVCKP